MNLEKPIVFFDGVCSLCNGFVDFLFRIDRHQKFQVASLQGETAKSSGIFDDQSQSMDSILVSIDGNVLQKSNAVLKIMTTIGGVWNIAYLAYLIPRPLRDTLYSFIATNRYAWFGKKDTCRLPTPAEQQRFLP